LFLKFLSGGAPYNFFQLIQNKISRKTGRHN
jgi:hypothetical protein